MKRTGKKADVVIVFERTCKGIGIFALEIGFEEIDIE